MTSMEALKIRAARAMAVIKLNASDNPDVWERVVAALEVQAWESIPRVHIQDVAADPSEIPDRF